MSVLHTVLASYVDQLQGALKRSKQATDPIIAKGSFDLVGEQQKLIQEKIEAISAYRLPEHRADLVRQFYDGSQPIIALEIEGRTAAEIRTVASKHLSSADQAKLADAVDRAIYSISCSSLKHKYPELAKQLKISSEMGLGLALTLNDVYKSAHSWAKFVQQDLEDIGQYVSLFDIEREIALNLNRPPTQVVSDRGLVSRYSFYHQKQQLFSKDDSRLQ